MDYMIFKQHREKKSLTFNISLMDFSDLVDPAAIASVFRFLKAGFTVSREKLICENCQSMLKTFLI